MKHIILASSSQYRKVLLSRLGLPFECISSNIDETKLIDEMPSNLVKRLSIGKAQVIANANPESVVIGSDQIAIFENQIIGKPGNHKTALTQLNAFSGKEIQFLTGVAVLRQLDNREEFAISEVNVRFKSLSDSQIKKYLRKDKPYDCAGSFKVESLGISLFDFVKSDDPTSLEGLPLILLCKLLNKVGIDIL